MWLKKLLVAALSLALAIAPVAADQSNTWSPTTGTVSGLQLTSNYNGGFKAIQTCNSGASAPTNDISAAAVKGQCWLDTSTTPNIYKRFDGTSWIILGYYDLTNHIFTPKMSGGTDTVASAGTTDLCSKQTNNLTISGTTGITSFGSNCLLGEGKWLTFSGALTLTHAASLFLPNAASNITTAANDKAYAVYNGSGNWVVPVYVKADGTSLSTTATFTGAVVLSGVISPTALASGTTNDWAPTSLSTAETLRATPNAAGSSLSGLTGGATGRQITITNISASANITFLGENTGSSAANRFALPFPLALHPAQEATFRYDGTSSRWRHVGPQRATQVPTRANLKVVNNTGAPTTTMDITADWLTVTDASGNAHRLQTVSVSPVITGSGANGLDTGTIASNVFYSLNVIYNPVTNTVAGLISVQSSCLSATLPSGYTACFRAGWAKVDANGSSSRFYRQVCGDNSCQYKVVGSTNSPNLPNPGTGTAGNVITPTWVALTIQGASGAGVWVPSTATGVKVVILNATGTSYILAAPNDQYGGNASTTNPPPCYTPTSDSAQICEFVLEATTIQWANNGGSNGLFIFGWRDNL